MINELIILFCATAVLFFVLSALVQFKYIYIVVPLNIAFLGLLLYSFVQFMGTAVPFQFNIPFMEAQHFTSKTLVTVEALFESPDLIHMVVADPRGDYRYVTYKKTPEFEAEIMKAFNDAEKMHSKLKMVMTDTMYGPDAGSIFADPKEGLQDNMHEEKPAQTDGVETHQATGTGGQTN